MSPRGWKITGGIMVAVGVLALAASVPLALYGLAMIATVFLLPLGLILVAGAVGLAILGVSLVVGGLFALRHGRRRPKKGQRRAPVRIGPAFVEVGG